MRDDSELTRPSTKEQGKSAPGRLDHGCQSHGAGGLQKNDAGLGYSV